MATRKLPTGGNCKGHIAKRAGKLLAITDCTIKADLLNKMEGKPKVKSTKTKTTSTKERNTQTYKRVFMAKKDIVKARSAVADGGCKGINGAAGKECAERVKLEGQSERRTEKYRKPHKGERYAIGGERLQYVAEKDEGD